MVGRIVNTLLPLGKFVCVVIAAALVVEHYGQAARVALLTWANVETISLGIALVKKGVRI